MLCVLLTELYGKPLLLMGDFNYPDIHWSSSCGHSPASQKFVDTVDDGFLTQHVATGTSNEAILDLVIMSEPDMIDAISVLDKLGNSDHNTIEWNVCVNPVYSLFNHLQETMHWLTSPQSVRLWTRLIGRMYYREMRTTWQAFHSHLRSLKDKYVPYKRSSKHGRKASWLTYKAVRLTKLNSIYCYSGHICLEPVQLVWCFVTPEKK